MIFNYNTEEINSVKDFIDKGSLKSNLVSKNCLYFDVGDYHKMLPTELIFNTTYRESLLASCIDLVLDEHDMVRYKYKPKLLSFDLYGTVDYWYILLIINNMKSVMEFTEKNIKIIPTDKLNVINEIISSNYEYIYNHNNDPLKTKVRDI